MPCIERSRRKVRTSAPTYCLSTAIYDLPVPLFSSIPISPCIAFHCLRVRCSPPCGNPSVESIVHTWQSTQTEALMTCSLVSVLHRDSCILPSRTFCTSVACFFHEERVTGSDRRRASGAGSRRGVMFCQPVIAPTTTSSRRRFLHWFRVDAVLFVLSSPFHFPSPSPALSSTSLAAVGLSPPSICPKTKFRLAVARTSISAFSGTYPPTPSIGGLIHQVGLILFFMVRPSADAHATIVISLDLALGDVAVRGIFARMSYMKTKPSGMAGRALQLICNLEHLVYVDAIYF